MIPKLLTYGIVWNLLTHVDGNFEHITPEAVPLSKKSANAETGVGVTSKP